MKTRATIWDNTPWVWRLSSVVGLVTGLGVAWRTSFCALYTPREVTVNAAAASADIVMLCVAPLAIVFWVELAWRGRFAWLWIAAWTSPIHCVLMALLTHGQSTGAAWLMTSSMTSADNTWVEAFVWANMGLQVWVGLRARRVGRVLDESRAPEAGARLEVPRARRIAGVASVALLRVLAALALLCIWYPQSVFYPLVSARLERK